MNIGRGTYENHTVVIKGYRIYERPKTILFFTIWEYLHFAEVSDHWVNYPRYFDFYQYANDLINNGIGSFSRIYYD